MRDFVVSSITCKRVERRQSGVRFIIGMFGKAKKRDIFFQSRGLMKEYLSLNVHIFGVNSCGKGKRERCNKTR